MGLRRVQRRGCECGGAYADRYGDGQGERELIRRSECDGVKRHDGERGIRHGIGSEQAMSAAVRIGVIHKIRYLKKLSTGFPLGS